MTKQTLKGSCLCGALKFVVTGEPTRFYHCHCSRCRKFTGSAHASNILINPEFFEWLDGEDQVGRFEHPEAKHFATCFCKRCGSSLPWLGKSGATIVIPAGTLDDDPGVRTAAHIFVASKAPWVEIGDDCPQFDEYPPGFDPSAES